MAARRTERAAAAPARGAKATADATDAGAGAAKAGWGMAEAMGILTALLLVAAILLADKYLGQSFNQGMFFKT